MSCQGNAYSLEGQITASTQIPGSDLKRALGLLLIAPPGSGGHDFAIQPGYGESDHWSQDATRHWENDKLGALKRAEGKE